MAEEPLPNLPPDQPSWVAKAIAHLNGAIAVLWAFTKVAAVLTMVAGSIGGIVAAYNSGKNLEKTTKVEVKQAETSVDTKRLIENATGKVEDKTAVVEAEANLNQVKAEAQSK